MFHAKDYFTRISPFIFALLLVWIPFGTRKFILHLTPGFDEYESIFIYFSDVAIILFAGLLARQTGLKKFFNAPRALWIFFAVAGASMFWAHSYPLALYSFTRLLLIIIFFLVVVRYLEKTPRAFGGAMIILAAASLFQALVGIAQFFTQDSVGLKYLGESQLGPGAIGVAKIATEYGRLIRAYGTLPHANIYAAFLIIGLVALYYLWVRRSDAATSVRKRFFSTALLSAAIFLVLTGLVLSFSRSGWISATVATLLFLSFSIFSSSQRKQMVGRLAVLIAISTFVLYQLFSFAIAPRIEMSTTADYSISSRLTYNQLGLNLISKKPFGVGIGNQVLYSVDEGLYQKAGMRRVWEWQPIHNIYLLVASEIGIIGLAMFTLFIVSIVFSNPKSEVQNLRHYQMKKIQKVKSEMFKKFNFLNLKVFSNFVLRAPNLKNHLSLERNASLTILFALLTFGLFDHFLWDLQPGRLMLWLSLALVYACCTRENVPVV